jgi:hypothetical protein
MQSSESGAGVSPKQSSAPSEIKPKPFPWGQRFWNIPIELSLTQYEVEIKEASPYLLSVQEFEGVIAKADELCRGSDPTFGMQLSVICWAKRCLDKSFLFRISHQREWILRIKRAARLALKTMREAGEDPILYFPNKLREYESAFAD